MTAQPFAWQPPKSIPGTRLLAISEMDITENILGQAKENTDSHFFSWLPTELMTISQLEHTQWIFQFHFGKQNPQNPYIPFFHTAECNTPTKTAHCQSMPTQRIVCLQYQINGEFADNEPLKQTALTSVWQEHFGEQWKNIIWHFMLWKIQLIQEWRTLSIIEIARIVARAQQLFFDSAFSFQMACQCLGLSWDTLGKHSYLNNDLHSYLNNDLNNYVIDQATQINLIRQLLPIFHIPAQQWTWNLGLQLDKTSQSEQIFFHQQQFQWKELENALSIGMPLRTALISFFQQYPATHSLVRSLFQLARENLVRKTRTESDLLNDINQLLSQKETKISNKKTTKKSKTPVQKIRDFWHDQCYQEMGDYNTKMQEFFQKNPVPKGVKIDLPLYHEKDTTQICLEFQDKEQALSQIQWLTKQLENPDLEKLIQ